MVDQALSEFMEQQELLGSVRRTLEMKIDGLQDHLVDLTQAQSRIRSADIAAESCDLNRSYIIRKASVSILAQANQQRRIILHLLKD